MNLWQMSAQGALMIAAIAAIRAIGAGRLPRWSFQALWAAAVARLLLPFRVPSPLSLYGAVDRARAALAPAAAPAAPLRLLAAPAPPAIAAPGAPPPALPSPVWIAWAAGAALCALWFLLAHRRGLRLYADSRPLAVRKLPGPAPRRVALRTSRRVDAPLTYGVLRPVVLIPAWLCAHPALDCVLAHELAHVRRFDALKKWLLAAALCAHWFNPLAWLLFALANRDIELGCDERALRALGDGFTARYATALIDLEARRSASAPLAAHFNRNAMEERIVAIMKHKKPTRIAVLVAVALVIGTGMALATSAMPAPAPGEIQFPAAELAPPAPAPEPADYAPYAPFGLAYGPDGGLYLDGERVRCFFEGGGATITFDASGTVDAYAVRGAAASPGAEPPLLGVRRFSDAAFAARSARIAESGGEYDAIIEDGMPKSEWAATEDVPRALPVPTATPVPADADEAPAPEWTVAEDVFVTPAPEPTVSEDVFVTAAGRYYHSRSDCSGMAGARPATLADARRAGKLACPACVAAPEEPAPAPDDGARIVLDTLIALYGPPPPDHAAQADTDAEALLLYCAKLVLEGRISPAQMSQILSPLP